MEINVFILAGQALLREAYYKVLSLKKLHFQGLILSERQIICLGKKYRFRGLYLRA